MENDEILEEWDVFINTELTPFLHLTPLPSSSLSTRFNTPAPSSSSSSSRFKPHAKRLELILPFDDLPRDNLVGERVRELQIEKGQQLVGTGWQWRRVQYLVGQFTNDGELHLTPVESVIPLNTCLTHLDDYDARMKLPSSSSSTSSGTASRRSNSHDDLATNHPSPANAAATGAAAVNSKAIQVQFRKKETEEQVLARLNSFSHLQRQVDDESWITLKHFNIDAQEVAAVRDKLIGTLREPLEFLPNEDYLDKVICFSADPSSSSSAIVIN